MGGELAHVCFGDFGDNVLVHCSVLIARWIGMLCSCCCWARLLIAVSSMGVLFVVEVVSGDAAVGVVNLVPVGM